MCIRNIVRQGDKVYNFAKDNITYTYPAFWFPYLLK